MITIFRLNLSFKIIFKILDIVDFPEPWPPVKPMIFVFSFKR